MHAPVDKKPLEPVRVIMVNISGNIEQQAFEIIGVHLEEDAAYHNIVIIGKEPEVRIGITVKSPVREIRHLLAAFRTIRRYDVLYIPCCQNVLE